MDQVDSWAAAVNTNNGEYRSVNCVPRLRRRCGCASNSAVLSLSPPYVPLLSFYLSRFVSSRRFFFFTFSRRVARAMHLAAITHACLLSPTGPQIRAICASRCNARLREEFPENPVNLNFNNQSGHSSINLEFSSAMSECWKKMDLRTFL